VKPESGKWKVEVKSKKQKEVEKFECRAQSFHSAEIESREKQQAKHVPCLCGVACLSNYYDFQ